MAPTMACKKRKAQTTITKVVAKQEIAYQKITKYIYKYMVSKWNLMNSQSNEWNLLFLPNMKIALQANVFTSMTHYNFASQIYSYASSNEDSGCKSRSGQGMEKAGANSSKAMEKRQEVTLEAQRGKKKVHVATLMNIGHLKNEELEPKVHKRHKQGCTPK